MKDAAIGIIALVLMISAYTIMSAIPTALGIALYRWVF